MRTRTITANSLDALVDTEVERLLTILAAIPNAAKARSAAQEYQARKHGFLLARAENRLTDIIPTTTSARDAENITDALIHLGRITAFQQIGYAVT